MKKLFKSQISFTLSTSTSIAPVEVEASILHDEYKLDETVNGLWIKTLETYNRHNGTDLMLGYKVIETEKFNPRNSSSYNISNFSKHVINFNVSRASDITSTVRSIFSAKLKEIASVLGYSYTDFGGYFDGRGVQFFGGNVEDDTTRLFNCCVDFRVDREKADTINQRELDLVPQRNRYKSVLHLSVESFSPARKLWEAYFEYADHSAYLHYFVALAFYGHVNNRNANCAGSFVTELEEANKAITRYSVLDFDAMFKMTAGDLKAELELWGFPTTNKKENLDRLEDYKKRLNNAKALLRTYKVDALEPSYTKLDERMQENCARAEEELQAGMMSFYNRQKAYKEAQKAE